MAEEISNHDRRTGWNDEFRASVQGTGGRSGIDVTREQEDVKAYQEGKVGSKRQTYDEGRMRLPKLQPSWSLGKQMQNCNIKPETRQSQET